MIAKLIIIESESINPYHNQAIEASLLDIVNEDTMALYIWANDKTVFIGKNQNAYTECNVGKLKEAGGFLARRISGGGAVYHDKGNLNFTFICSKENYSQANNFKVVLDAVRSFGIEAVLSGRNDCTIDGRKFSGNAFYSGAGKCFHHGTVLINTAAGEIAKYLNVSQAKLETKGVKSVVSRVTNLSEHSSDVSYSSFSTALKKSFIDSFGGREVSILKTADVDKALFDKWYGFFANEARIMGDDAVYNFRLEHRFDWGLCDIRLQITDGIIEKVKIYTDSLLFDMTERERELSGMAINDCTDSGVSDILNAIRENL